MTEALLQYIWKMRLYAPGGLQTTDGDAVTILQPGIQNTNAGPDFSNARIQIGDTLWAGNVELHMYSSQWMEHGHQHDPAYQNVILHVVLHHDLPAFHLPTLALHPYINQQLLHTYRHMMETGAWIPCARFLPAAASNRMDGWLERMAIERLEDKAMRLRSRLIANQGDWDETAWQLLARSLGNPVNADPMEQMAIQTPVRILQRHSGQRNQIEALLLGQAGFLEGSWRELYPHQLQTEYRHLRQKYQLDPLKPGQWKFGRMRPSHFPTIRISQLADIVCQEPRLFRLMTDLDKKKLDALFAGTAAPYWKEHFHFKEASTSHSTQIGATIRHSILINTVVPLLVLYGKETDDGTWIEKGLDLLSNIPKEDNQVIRQWAESGVHAANAHQSQGLLHLYQHWCCEKRCLECTVGYQILEKVKYI
jgi:hypothetical protein